MWPSPKPKEALGDAQGAPTRGSRPLHQLERGAPAAPQCLFGIGVALRDQWRASLVESLGQAIVSFGPRCRNSLGVGGGSSSLCSVMRWAVLGALEGQQKRCCLLPSSSGDLTVYLREICSVVRTLMDECHSQSRQSPQVPSWTPAAPVCRLQEYMYVQEG
jgi:hypothetical protein